MINQFDTFFYHLINQQLTAGWLDFIMVKFSDKTFWIPFYCIVIWLLSREYKKKTILIVAFIGLAVLASDRISSGVLKPLIKRQRPCLEASLTPRVLAPCNDTGSMPSSHASNHFSVAIFFILLLGFRKKSNTAFWLIWAFSISYSRVYCGVHYPTDVMAGAFLGMALGAGCFYLYQFANGRIKWH